MSHGRGSPDRLTVLIGLWTHGSHHADLERSAASLQPADNTLLWSGTGAKLDYATSLRSSSPRFDYTHPLLTQHPRSHLPPADETTPCQSLVLHLLMCAHLPAIYLITWGWVGRVGLCRGSWEARDRRSFWTGEHRKDEQQTVTQDDWFYKNTHKLFSSPPLRLKCCLK